jgi:L-rhamnose mutarotase
MARQIFVLDLKDEAMAAAYEDWHRPGRVPAQVLRDIVASGIVAMEIHRTGNRLVMVTQTADEAPPADRTGSPESQAWEVRMDAYQQPLPWAAPGEKWVAATRIFDLAEHL